MNIFSKIINGLKKTKDALAQKFNNLFKKSELSVDFYDELEEILFTSDIGVKTSLYIINEMQSRAKKNGVKTTAGAKSILKDIMLELLTYDEVVFDYPMTLTIVGVNGVGKTTTIGKLAHFFQVIGKSVTLVAGDTFRAAASSQLAEWAKRNKVRIISQGEGSDPSAVVFDGIASAKSKKTDVLIIDTAGRLHNKTNLMEELKKINKITNREWTEAKHINLIVLDATTGQNAISQVDAFKDAIGIDGIILTKLDGSAKGGVVLGIAHEMKLPIYFVGVGEGINDLEMFNAGVFVDAILN